VPGTTQSTFALTVVIACAYTSMMTAQARQPLKMSNVKIQQLSQTQAEVGLSPEEGPKPGIVVDRLRRLKECTNCAARMPSEARMVALADPINVEYTAK
jgi:hypothetical protein